MGRPSKGGFHKVATRLADGTRVVYWYAWKGGPRLPGQPGSREFRQAYAKALEFKPTEPKLIERRRSQTIETVVDGYLDGVEFSQLAERTKRDYRKQASAIVAAFGQMELEALDSPQALGIFQGWRDRLAKASLRQADYAWTFINLVLNWGKRRGMIAANPLRDSGVKKLYRTTRADKIWSDAWIEAFYAHASDEIALAMALALWTGQRQGDLLRLTWGDYDGTHIRLRQSKGGKKVAVRVAAPLRIALDQTERRHQRILVNSDGNPWSEDGFRVSWGKTCVKAKVPNSRLGGVTFHDLRGTAVTRLFLIGCEIAEIATLTGHKVNQVQTILDEHYFHRDVRLGDRAIKRYEESPYARLEAARFSTPRHLGIKTQPIDFVEAKKRVRENFPE